MRGGRDVILQAAIKIFARKGYAGASTREICQAAGVTKPVLYYHFRSKEHLYQELMIDSFGQFNKTLLRSSRFKGALRERLTHMVYNDFLDTKADPERVRFILRMIFSPGGKHPFFDYIREMEAQRKVIAGVFQEAIKKGKIRGNARDLATALMGMQLIATLENLFTKRPTLTRKSAQKWVDILLRGCSSE